MNANNTTSTYNELIPVTEENQDGKFIADLFDDEGAFGEADCAGL